MTISTGNYESREGVNRHMFPAETVDGERVMIVEKITRANQSTVLIAEDGRQFESAPGGDPMSLVEVALDRLEGVVEDAVEYVEDVAEAVADAAGDALDSIQDTLGMNDEEEVDGEAPEEAA